ncbi:putative ribonuclease H-like domain, reverse transcriptase zinc-binding domain-containing protein [Senna tora]|uniref:Putative ribonuclease H-like domain, reverse transcriptase zinc-binding domain-containing protein n=1 Tax=Senna tora TaxID=362788 RepID=A0A834TXD3_9FABA|nr:putative ribonuclease H-like domain, reverse transcriptase zinc-binding domain-containing protein [Senna tora]
MMHSQTKSQTKGVNKVNSEVLLEKLNSLTVSESTASSPSKDKINQEGSMMEVSSYHCSTWKRQIRFDMNKEGEKWEVGSKRARDEVIDNDSKMEVMQHEEGCIKQCPNLLVCMLISEYREWNKAAISVFFPPIIANNILSIPISRQQKEDSWYWSLTPNGHYTVKSGYKELRKIKLPNIHDSFFHQFTDVWKRVWKLKLPAKIKFFIWRACREILPVCSNLIKKGVDVDMWCPVCKEEEESVSHAVLHCSHLRDFWRQLPIPFMDESVEDVPFIDWFNMALTQWKEEELCIFAIATYKVWNRRNEIRLGANTMPIQLLKDSILSLWNEINSLPETFEQSSHRHEPPMGWTPPPFNLLKVNVDASKKSDNATGLGCVIRNHQGRVLGAVAKRAQPCATVEQLEASAVLLGLEFARGFGCEAVMLEGDACGVIKQLNSQSELISLVGTIVDNIKVVCNEFSSISFGWVPRSANSVANKLAIFGSSILSEEVWLEDHPVFLSDVLALDGCILC